MVGYTLLSITSKPVFKKKKVSAQNQFIGLSLINITFNINIDFMTAKFNTYNLCILSLLSVTNHCTFTIIHCKTIIFFYNTCPILNISTQNVKEYWMRPTRSELLYFVFRMEKIVLRCLHYFSFFVSKQLQRTKSLKYVRLLN